MADGTIYRGFDIGRGDDRTVWQVRRNGQNLGTFGSEDEAMGFCDRLKKQDRETRTILDRDPPSFLSEREA